MINIIVSKDTPLYACDLSYYYLYKKENDLLHLNLQKQDGSIESQYELDCYDLQVSKIPHLTQLLKNFPNPISLIILTRYLPNHLHLTL